MGSQHFLEKYLKVDYEVTPQDRTMSHTPPPKSLTWVQIKPLGGTFGGFGAGESSAVTHLAGRPPPHQALFQQV